MTQFTLMLSLQLQLTAAAAATVRLVISMMSARTIASAKRFNFGYLEVSLGSSSTVECIDSTAPACKLPQSRVGHVNTKRLIVLHIVTFASGHLTCVSFDSSGRLLV